MNKYPFKLFCIVTYKLDRTNISSFHVYIPKNEILRSGTFGYSNYSDQSFWVALHKTSTPGLGDCSSLIIAELFKLIDLVFTDGTFKLFHRFSNGCRAGI